MYVHTSLASYKCPDYSGAWFNTFKQMAISLQ